VEEGKASLTPTHFTLRCIRTFLPQRAKRPCADVDVTSTCEAGSNILREDIGGIAGRFVIINVRIPFTAALAVAMLDSRGVVPPSSSFELQGLPIRHPASLSPLLFTHHNANSSLRPIPPSTSSSIHTTASPGGHRCSRRLHPALQLPR
jgi:hypothetical protein